MTGLIYRKATEKELSCFILYPNGLSAYFWLTCCKGTVNIRDPLVYGAYSSAYVFYKEVNGQPIYATKDDLDRHIDHLPTKEPICQSKPTERPQIKTFPECFARYVVGTLSRIGFMNGK